MKIFSCIFAAVLLISTFSCINESEKQSEKNHTNTENNQSEGKDDLPMFEFVTKSHDFGKIKQGEMVSYSFRFKNVGKSDLIISSARASCGCTVPKW